ncbi:MAG: serine/threonine-protein kinase [Chlamydiota bacterium]
MKKIGEGAYSTVYKAVLDGRTIAVKCIDKSRFRNPQILRKKKLEQQFLQEIENPFINKLYRVIEAEEYIIYHMEWCPYDLYYLLYEVSDEGYSLSPKQTTLCAAEVLSALESVHEKEYIYRDLKPENILVNTEGHLQLCDFDFIKHLSQGRKRANTFVGTPECQPPELIKSTFSQNPSPGTSYDGYAYDRWTFGIFLYELLYKETPIPPLSEELDDSGNLRTNEYYTRVVKTDLRKLLSEKSSSPGLDLIKQLLDHNPNNRPQWDAIKRHPFFEDICWKDLAAKRIPGPFATP